MTLAQWRRMTDDQRDRWVYTAQSWLARWDRGDVVWSIEMGGLGPGYEQAIQVAMAEILRHLIDKNYVAAMWNDAETWKDDRKRIERWSHQSPALGALRLSGAQYGAALSLATGFYWDGPHAVLSIPKFTGRLIQVSRTFPDGPVPESLVETRPVRLLDLGP